jgi:ectoine hydroxylase-related dioxygenase (phytanoyl-CoA dioxygenase family)
MNHAAATSITNTDVECYAADGAVCIKNAFDADWVTSIREGFERTLSQPSQWFSDHAPEEGAGRFVTDLAMAQRDTVFRRFVHESPAAELVALLLGTKQLNFFFDSMWIKGSGIRKRTNWHQDLPYYTVDGDQLCVLWLALDPVPADISLQFVRGSHRWGRWFEPTRTTEGTSWYEDSPYEPVPDIDNEPDRFDLISWEVQPGDCVVFHGMTLHGATGNRLAYDRRAYSSVWLGDDVTWAERPGFSRPRFEGHGLSPGDPVDCEMFPRVWPRA